jgi:hypothetical protein
MLCVQMLCLLYSRFTHDGRAPLPVPPIGALTDRCSHARTAITFPAPSPSDSLYALALGQRPAAIERPFGKCDSVLHFPIPFYLGGDPAILPFAQHIKGATIYCTSDMTGGWGSGQKPGPHSEYELVLVLPNGSPLGPHIRKGRSIRRAGPASFSPGTANTAARRC